MNDTHAKILDGLREFFETFLPAAVEHYEKSAPTVSEYCDDLYRRRGECQLTEIQTALYLFDRESGWMQPSYAANTIYHLMQRCGMPTVGHAGF